MDAESEELHLSPGHEPVRDQHRVAEQLPTLSSSEVSRVGFDFNLGPEGMAGSTQSSRFSILLPPETSSAATAQDSEEYKPALTLQDLLVEPKIEEEDYQEHPQIDLLSYEEEVEQAEAELTASSAGMQHFERLWKKETEEYLAKKAEFEEIEARYMERKEVYLEALDNKKRKLQNAKIDFEFKVQKLREAREADEGQNCVKLGKQMRGSIPDVYVLCVDE
uniref:FAM192A_Fyv6_N domain-containing protein n=1 Tax=Steinernema glaseri TaxID=37863 RepID=A0A1I8A6V2_9BILA